MRSQKSRQLRDQWRSGGNKVMANWTDGERETFSWAMLPTEPIAKQPKAKKRKLKKKVRQRI